MLEMHRKVHSEPQEVLRVHPEAECVHGLLRCAGCAADAHRILVADDLHRQRIVAFPGRAPENDVGDPLSSPLSTRGRLPHPISMAYGVHMVYADARF
ncbi:MAG TPA: hypothetical protein DDY59_07960 [Lachnospiraceae bacterium]|nr:hypothetical protein [Lachnospiraceae bacterium]